MYKVGMISLGCPKNRIDAEIMLKKLLDAGYTVTPDETEADAIIVNTCGFIEDAKAEAIENILEAAELKKEGRLKALIVTGCLAERYRDDIFKEMPEVDAVIGLAGNRDIAEAVRDALEGKRPGVFGEKEALAIEGERILTTPKYTAYIKIAEGCDNCCTYCAIPKIRGRFRSRPEESIVSEAEALAAQGVRELVVVAQDTTRYGIDLYGRPMLPDLLKKLCRIEDIRWIRILYTYPDLITDELLDTMVSEEKILNYLDIPIQHCNAEILKRMNRTGNKKTLEELLARIRAKIPDVTLRTTLISGFPGETDEQFEELCEFVKSARFDRLGCFAYSEEEGTAAAEYEDQVPPQVRADRAGIIMNDQTSVTDAVNKKRIGSSEEVLVEGYDDYIKCFYGRGRFDAPDIDGKVFFTSPRRVEAGTFVRVRINDCLEYDLLGELEE